MTTTEIPQGTLVGNRYLIQQVLGQGGFGRTYKAYDQHRFGKPCVLKEFIPRTNNPQGLQKAQELFEREAKILFQLKHPQIPEFFGTFSENGRLFIVQEYVDGKNYWTLLRERQHFSEAEVIRLLDAILPILDYIHEQNIFHRDISPDNIMQPNNLNQLPVLIDFGVVKQIYATGINNTSLLESHTRVGKRGYAPPEQMQLGQCFPSSDLYALASTAIFLLTGKTPNVLAWESHPSLSKEFQKVLKKMLKDKPNERYQSAKEVIAALQSQATIQQSQQLPGSTKVPNNEVTVPPSIASVTTTAGQAFPYLLGFLTVLLVVGIGVAVLSPYIPIVCSVLNNCVQNRKTPQTQPSSPPPSPTNLETTPPTNGQPTPSKLPSCRDVLFGDCSP
ncbi:MAG: serine/threonine protein kinase [Stigonema ocellatum SAG 48.90 = DSM 106950]|nr:serine/threonine protein kinase [Stigonema ocellatum SAG 48.90 = DSM 106950]